MPEFDELSPNITPDEMDVKLTPDDLRKWGNKDTEEMGAFIFNGWFYSLHISADVLQQLKAGQTVKVKAYRQTR